MSLTAESPLRRRRLEVIGQVVDRTEPLIDGSLKLINLLLVSDRRGVGGAEGFNELHTAAAVRT